MSIFLNLDLQDLFHISENNQVSLYDGELGLDCMSKIQTENMLPGEHMAWVRATKGDDFVVAMRKDSMSMTQVQLYQNATEMQITAYMIVEHVYNLIKRGHSLRSKQCACANNLPARRRCQLALPRACNFASACPCKSHGDAIFDADIQFELGASSLDLPCFGQKSIKDVIVDSDVFRFTDRGWVIKSDKNVSCIDTLHAFIQRHPLGVSFKNTNIQYKRLEIDLHILKTKGLVFELEETKSEDGCARFFRGYDLHDQKQVDDDIRKMWHDAGHQQESY